MTGPRGAPTRRPETADDAAFRFALFRDSRQPNESLGSIGEPLASQLMRHQFVGQDASYRAAYPAARHEILEVDGEPIGRLVVDEDRAAWTLVDIALASAWRGRGLGTRLLSEIIAGARAAGVPLRLRVMISNGAAARLYERCGFKAVQMGDVDIDMEIA